MKRPPHHFVVEVKRQRRSTNAVGKSWLDDPRFAAAAAEAASAVGVLELEPKLEETKPAAPAAPSRPSGRILPSLVEVELPSLVEVEPEPEPVEIVEPPRRRERKVEAALQAAEALFSSRGEPDLGPPDPAPPALETLAFVAEPVAKVPATRKAKKTKKPTAAAPEAAPQSLGVKALAEALTARAARAVGELRVEAAEEEGSSADRAERRQARHRRILERYVRGAEAKPGQRWKLRLQKRRK